ncbi:MAG: cupin domain-containing protein [Candidatus Nanohaloarchaea archaeon]|nr:cupin domain-containing protein [Candidatus Nanohaloarchaea archaeon]
MTDHLLTPEDDPAFDQEGLTGYRYPLDNDELELYRVDVTRGHDTYIVSREITHIYRVLDGRGVFTIDGDDQRVEAGDTVEVPPGVEYTYSGSMELLLIMQPPWFEGNEEVTRPNPAVQS